MFDIIGKRRYGYLISAVFTIAGLLFIVATLVPNGGLGLQFSIAYTGGTVWEIGFEDGAPDPAEVRAVLEEQGLVGSEVAITGADGRDYVLIRTEALDLVETQPADGAVDAAGSPSPSAGPSVSPEPSASPVLAAGGDDGDAVARVPTEGQFGALAAALQESFGPIDEVRQQNSVGPVVSAELVQQTILLILFASLAIMAYISYRFRDLRMGVTAVVALVQDVIVTVGAYAFLGTIMDLQVDALFVTAMLTVIGFSVHDTIVVFDRVRENRQRYMGEPLSDIVNHSIVQTLGRSLTTSLTILLTLLALLIFGGEAIRPFTLALTIGIITGTFSSIFVAVPLFLDWHLWDERRKLSAAPARKVKAKASAS